MDRGEKKISVVYLVYDVSMLFGGMRVIFEHVNRLQELGHEVEIWHAGSSDTPYFECHVPIKRYQVGLLDKPDVLVMTDPGFIPDVSKYRQKRATFYLVQHDNEFINELAKSTTEVGRVREYIHHFQTGQWSIIVVSTWLKDVVKDKYDLPSIVIRNGIDHSLFHPSPPIINFRKPTVLLYYDPQAWKGFSEALYATRIVKENVMDLEIIIIGKLFPEENPAADRYFGLTFPALFISKPEQANLAGLYSSATVFVSSSWKEGFGLPGLEAIACGTPLVTTDSGGSSEYAIDNQTAVIVPAQDPTGIALGIAKVLQDASLRAHLSHEGVRKAKEFKWSRSINELEYLFKKSMLKP